jgi:5-methylcytosine-specific restriction endonuclease McrA
VSSVHALVSPSVRARIIVLDGGRCALCGARGGDAGLHVGHLIPVARGLEAGLTEADLNSDENLAAMCAECNLGLSDNPVPLRIAVAILRMRLTLARRDG